MNRILYQTVEDRDNPDEIENNGPYFCKDNNAWLGHGYYFWDTIINLAHWWGNLRYSKSGYVICKSSMSEESMKEVYDLVGKPELILELQKASEIIKTRAGTSSVYIPEIIEYLKKKTSFLRLYKAIRAFPIDTLPLEMREKLKFNNKHGGYIDTLPAIQICVIDKSILNEEYQIVYPDIYCSEAVM